MRFIAKDRAGRPLALLEAADKLDAELYSLRGGVKGYHSLVDMAAEERAVVASQARLRGSWRAYGLSEAEAAIAAAPDGPYRPPCVRAIAVPKQAADPRFLPKPRAKLAERASWGRAYDVELRERQN